MSENRKNQMTNQENQLATIEETDSTTIFSDSTKTMINTDSTKNETQNANSASNADSIIPIYTCKDQYATEIEQYKDILRFLQQINYQVGERIYIRAIKEVWDQDKEKWVSRPRGTFTGILGEEFFENFWQIMNTKNAKKTKYNIADLTSVCDGYWLVKKFQNGMKFLNDLNFQNCSIYFNVNGCVTNSNCEKIKANFYEIDDKSIDEQKEIAEKNRVALVLNTGNTSLHNYFPLPESDRKNFLDWKKIQLGLIGHTESDSTIKDLARLMRLPTFKHPKTGQIAIYDIYSNKKFSTQELKEIFCLKEKQISEEKTNQIVENTSNPNLVTEKIFPSKIKQLDDETLDEIIEDALSFLEKREPGAGKKGKIRDENGILRNHYDEWFSILCALWNFYGNEDKVVDLMNKYAGDAENWRDKLETLYDKTPSKKIKIGTVFYIAKAYGFIFPKVEKEPNKNNSLSTKELMEITEDFPLRFNLRSMAIEYDGEPLNKGKLPYMVLSQDYDLEVNKEKAKDVFNYQARKNEYDPIKIELEAIRENTERINIDKLATRYLGTNDPLYDLMFKKFLIGMVARIYNPGCKHDCCLVLKGNQRLGKSTLLKILATGGKQKKPNPFLDEFNFNNNNKDEIMKMNQAWVIEIAELDRITNKREAGIVKAFLSKNDDKIRLPYGAEIEDYPRRCVFAGTVNEDEFLNDPTGSGRFWAIPVEAEKIDIETLKQERDGLLASAIDAFFAGEQWWLEGEEYEASEANNKQFEIQDAWYDTIQRQVEGKNELGTTSFVIDQALGIKDADQTNQTKGRVKKILKQLGYKEVRRLRENKNIRVWINTSGSSGNLG